MQGIEPITCWLPVSLLLKPFALLYTDSDGERRLQKMCMKVYGIYWILLLNVFIKFYTIKFYTSLHVDKLTF